MAYLRTSGLHQDFDGLIRLHNSINADRMNYEQKVHQLFAAGDYKGAARCAHMIIDCQNRMARIRVCLDELCPKNNNKNRKH